LSKVKLEEVNILNDAVETFAVTNHPPKYVLSKTRHGHGRVVIGPTVDPPVFEGVIEYSEEHVKLDV
jgi:hypothetical protein